MTHTDFLALPITVPTTGGTLGAGDVVANSAAENAIATAALIAANDWQVGDVIDIEAWGYCSTTGSPTLTLKLNIGSTVLFTTGAVAVGTGITNQVLRIAARLVVCAVSASGKVSCVGLFEAPAIVAGTPNTGTGTAGQITVDMTAAQTLTLTAQWSAASASNTLTINQLLMARRR